MQFIDNLHNCQLFKENPILLIYNLTDYWKLHEKLKNFELKKSFIHSY
jgi:hypothetical protein